MYLLYDYSASFKMHIGCSAPLIHVYMYVLKYHGENTAKMNVSSKQSYKPGQLWVSLSAILLLPRAYYGIRVFSQIQVPLVRVSLGQSAVWMEIIVVSSYFVCRKVCSWIETETFWDNVTNIMALINSHSTYQNFIECLLCFGGIIGRVKLAFKCRRLKWRSKIEIVFVWPPFGFTMQNRTRIEKELS